MNRWHPFIVLSTLALVALVGVTGEAQDRAEEPAPEGGTLRVHIVGLHSTHGNIGCALFASSEGFPGEPSRALQKALGQFGRSHTASCTFEGVPRGRYAVSLGHDENGNGELDKNLIGLPSEAWGVSNDAPVQMAPPRFEDAAFQFNGRRQLIAVTLRYGI